jgi:hypothetical protein
MCDRVSIDCHLHVCWDAVSCSDHTCAATAASPSCTGLSTLDSVRCIMCCIMSYTPTQCSVCVHAGFAYAPLLAARLVCGRLARPAALVGAAAAAVRGVLRVLHLRGLSPNSLIKQLQEAALSFGSSCLEVRGGQKAPVLAVSATVTPLSATGILLATVACVIIAFAAVLSASVCAFSLRTKCAYWPEPWTLVLSVSSCAASAPVSTCFAGCREGG